MPLDFHVREGRASDELTYESVWGIKCSPHFKMGITMLIKMGDKPAFEANLPADLRPEARERSLAIIARMAADQ